MVIRRGDEVADWHGRNDDDDIYDYRYTVSY